MWLFCRASTTRLRLYLKHRCFKIHTLSSRIHMENPLFNSLSCKFCITIGILWPQQLYTLVRLIAKNAKASSNSSRIMLKWICSGKEKGIRHLIWIIRTRAIRLSYISPSNHQHLRQHSSNSSPRLTHLSPSGTMIQTIVLRWANSESNSKKLKTCY